MGGVFISYRRGDASGYAGRLREGLERRLGAGQVFRDADTIRPGQDFVQAIDAQVSGCAALLALIGEEWLHATNAAGQQRLGLADDFVTLEIAGALKRPDVLVVPVLVEGTRMPAADDLPPAIRDLSKRQAISLRDESWDEDVDRLAAVLERACHEPAAPRSSGIVRVVQIAALVFALAMAALLVGRFRSVRVDPSTQTPAGTSSAEGPARGTPGSGYPIDIPRIAEFADGTVTHTVLSGTVTPRGNVNLLALRVRFTNDGGSDANFWNSSYRLLAADQTLSPSGSLNEVVSSHAAKDGDVAFEVPIGVQKVRLQVDSRTDTPGALALDLARTGRPAIVPHAVVTRVSEGDQPLVSNRSVSLTLTSVTTRRFVNVLRVIFAIRLNNSTNYPKYFGSTAARVLVDGVATAPNSGPSEAVAGGSASPARDFVFDLPPSTERVVLRATLDEEVVEKPFKLSPQ
jgi:hypothetical protein